MKVNVKRQIAFNAHTDKWEMVYDILTPSGTYITTCTRNKLKKTLKEFRDKREQSFKQPILRLVRE